MEAGFVILIAVLASAIGVAVGMFIGKPNTSKADTQGVIYVYYGDIPNKPSLHLEGSVPIDEIASKKRVQFDVVVIG